jgi:hypothetical protein
VDGDGRRISALFPQASRQRPAVSGNGITVEVGGKVIAAQFRAVCDCHALIFSGSAWL